jgi:hypothetical protein
VTAAYAQSNWLNRKELAVVGGFQSAVGRIGALLLDALVSFVCADDHVSVVTRRRSHWIARKPLETSINRLDVCTLLSSDSRYCIVQMIVGPAGNFEGEVAATTAEVMFLDGSVSNLRSELS